MRRLSESLPESAPSIPSYAFAGGGVQRIHQIRSYYVVIVPAGDSQALSMTPSKRSTLVCTSAKTVAVCEATDFANELSEPRGGVRRAAGQRLRRRTVAPFRGGRRRAVR